MSARLLKMDDYGIFIWPAYGITAIVLLSILGLSLYRLRTLQRELDNLEEIKLGYKTLEN